MLFLSEPLCCEFVLRKVYGIIPGNNSLRCERAMGRYVKKSITDLRKVVHATRGIPGND